MANQNGLTFSSDTDGQLDIVYNLVWSQMCQRESGLVNLNYVPHVLKLLVSGRIQRTGLISGCLWDAGEPWSHRGCIAQITLNGQ